MTSAAAPAPVSRWPTVDLTDPMTHCPGFQPSSPHSSLRLSNSTASPTGVPVAWHSIRSGKFGFHPARLYAERIARSWPSLAGASRLPCMSFDTPAPHKTPWTVSPARSASVSRLRTKMPAPSPTTRPSAAASNGEHRPLGDSARSCAKPICVYRQSGRDAPPASIASARPDRSSSHANLIA